MRIVLSALAALAIVTSSIVAAVPASADPTSGTVTGTVTGGGGAGPLAGVRVSANPVSGVGGGSATTDASGSYTISDIAPGDYDVNAFSTDYPSTGNTFDANHVHRISVTAGVTSTLDFPLTHGATLAGRVIDENGSGVANAMLFVVYDRAGAVGYNYSDANGYFSIGVDGPEWIQRDSVGVYASKDGYVPGATVEVTLHENQHEYVTVSIAHPTPFTAAPTPKITGSLHVGKTLRVHPGVWKPSPGILSYQWYRSGKKISGATRTTYKLVKKDLRKKISVTVTGWMPSRLLTVRTSVSTARVLKRK